MEIIEFFNKKPKINCNIDKFSCPPLNACNIALKVIKHQCQCQQTAEVLSSLFPSFFFFLWANGGYSTPPTWLCYWTLHSSMSLRYERAIKL